MIVIVIVLLLLFTLLYLASKSNSSNSTRSLVSDIDSLKEMDRVFLEKAYSFASTLNLTKKTDIEALGNAFSLGHLLNEFFSAYVKVELEGDNLSKKIYIERSQTFVFGISRCFILHNNHFGKLGGLEELSLLTGDPNDKEVDSYDKGIETLIKDPQIVIPFRSLSKKFPEEVKRGVTELQDLYKELGSIGKKEIKVEEFSFFLRCLQYSFIDPGSNNPIHQKS